MVVDAPEVQRFVVRALDDIALGRGDYVRHLSVPFVIGPGLWREMLESDAALGNLGTPSVSVVPMNERPVALKMRTFVNKDAVEKISHHNRLIGVAQAFRGGEVRPATSQERKLFYALSPLEISGNPLTMVCVAPDRRLAIYVENGRLVWIDLLSAFMKGP
jgi:hypothetical protein